MAEHSYYTYNLDDSKTPGGIKVRFRVHVVKGRAARSYDARQAAAIREIAQWMIKHQSRDQD